MRIWTIVFFLSVFVNAALLGQIPPETPPETGTETDIQIVVSEVPERPQGPPLVLPGPGLVPVPPPPEVEIDEFIPPSPPGGRGQAFPPPYVIQWYAKNYEIDCLLIKYYGDDDDEMNRVANEVSVKIRRAVGCSRVVSYPDSYVVVIISKRRMAEAQALLGPEMLPLTPSLEWNPHGQQRSHQAGQYRPPDCSSGARR